MTLLVTRPRRSLSMFPATTNAPVDIEETDAAFQVDLDLPNVDVADLRIELRDNEIRIFGKHRDRRRTGMLRHQARRTGEFEYLIALPGDIEPDGVEADLDGGVLSIKAPKTGENRARRIEVHDGKKKGGSADPVVTPAAKAKQMKEGQSQPGPASQHMGSAGTGSTGQVARSSMA